MKAKILSISLTLVAGVIGFIVGHTSNRSTHVDVDSRFKADSGEAASSTRSRNWGVLAYPPAQYPPKNLY